MESAPVAGELRSANKNLRSEFQGKSRAKHSTVYTRIIARDRVRDIKAILMRVDGDWSSVSFKDS